MMNKKSFLWVAVAFIAGGVVAARQNIINNQNDRPSLLSRKKIVEAKPPVLPAELPEPKEHDVAVILIAQLPKEGNAKDIGCNNTTKTLTRKSTFKGNPVQDALEVLFALQQAGYENGTLYNALYQSNLKVQSVKIKNNIVTAELTGHIKLGGECDIPRVREQLVGTIKAASKAEKVIVLVNGKKLDDVLTLK